MNRRELLQRTAALGFLRALFLFHLLFRQGCPLKGPMNATPTSRGSCWSAETTRNRKYSRCFRRFRRCCGH